MLYITHQPEDEKKVEKKHIHVMIHFDYPRTSSGFCSAFGMGRFVKSGDTYKSCPLIMLIVQGYLLYKLPILSHAEIVSSPADYFLCFASRPFKSIKAGKKDMRYRTLLFAVMKMNYGRVGLSGVATVQ